MKTTFDLPDDLVRQARVRAEHRGQSLDALVHEALVSHLGVSIEGAELSPAWRAVLGRATLEQAREIDSVVDADLANVEVGAWD